MKSIELITELAERQELIKRAVVGLKNSLIIVKQEVDQLESYSIATKEIDKALEIAVQAIKCLDNDAVIYTKLKTYLTSK